LFVKRLSAGALVELAGETSKRDRGVLETVTRLRLLSGQQLERLLFTEGENPASNARLARRTLARLVERGCLDRLERRIGGVRAGAAGHVYFATGRAQRLVAYWNGYGLQRPRSRYEPSAAFARHTLAIAECYVQLVEADRAGDTELIAFDAEPACWQSYIGVGGVRQWVKPDALVRLGLDASHEARAWLEVDCGTEGRTALVRKCRAYASCYRAGGLEVFPRVVWIATNKRRAALLVEVCSWLPAEDWKLFAVTTSPQVLDALTGTVTS
jgi:hypothetical protein